MTGFCGWYGLDATDESGRRIDAMTSELTRYSGASAVTAGGTGWGAACAAIRQPPRFWTDNGTFVLIHGRPEYRDSKLGKAVREHGELRAISDTYHRDGSAFLETIDGPFALAVGSMQDRRVLLATDRLGVNELFYSLTDTGVVFATSLPAVVRHPQVGGEPDPQSVFNYLYFHVIPGPATIYRAVRKLEPGSYVEVSDGGADVRSYWSIRFTREREKVPFATLKQEFRDTLVAGVEREVSGGGSVGCFLSGGTDSSTVTGVLTQVLGKPAETFSIGFDESGYDEMEYARIAARAFGSRHHEHYVTPEEVVDLIPKISTIYGQPFGNSSAVPTFYCAHMARAQGVDRMLAGDGGDELFGGNQRYSTQALFSLYERIPAAARRSFLEPVAFNFPGGEKLFPVRKLRRYIEQARVAMPDRMETYNLMRMLGSTNMLTPEFLAGVDEGRPGQELTRVYDAVDAETMLNRILALDFKFTLADNDLPKVIRMCELAGMQVGFPLLSESLLEFSSQLPADQKVRRLKLRYFFKEALRDLLPDEVINKRKHGFGLPIGRWLATHSGLRDLARDSLNQFRRRGIMQPQFIDDLVDVKLAAYPDYYGTLVWIIIILEHWYSEQGPG